MRYRSACPRPTLLAVLLLVSLVATTGCRQIASKRAGAAAAAPAAFDVETTDASRMLAGIRPTNAKAHAVALALPEWQDWEREATERWSAFSADRVAPLRAWTSAADAVTGTHCPTLLVPFGGTRFIGAYTMIPGCDEYVLIGSEAVGQLPALDALTAAQLTSLAEDVRQLFPEVFPKPARGAPAHHSAPHDGPRITGAIPSLLVQLARLDARIVSATRFDIGSDGRPLEAIPIAGGNGRPAALSLTFEVPNGHPQSVVYLPADLDDGSIRRRPGVWTFLRLQAPFVTLLAPRPAASSERCSLLRDLVRDQSLALLQATPEWATVSAAEWTVSTLAPLPPQAFGHPIAPVFAVRHSAVAGGAK